MAKKISQLTQATEVKSDDVTVIVQDGETKKLPLNMMVTKQDIENKKIAGLAKLDEIEATYENDTYTPTITVKNKSSVKTGEGDEVDYSANVMDGHVKSAILSGNTLVSLVIGGNEQKQVGKGSATLAKYNFIHPLDHTKTYTLFFEVNGFVGEHNFVVSLTGGYNGSTTINKGGTYKIKISPSSKNDGKMKSLWFYWESTKWSDNNQAFINNIVLIEGDHTQEDIPYFTGMQSVKMPLLTTSNEDGTKSNILTANEEVELRGIGGVKDELNLKTGEVTERIGEIVLDGSEQWIQHVNTTSDVLLAYSPLQHGGNNGAESLLCDKLRVAVGMNAIYLSGQNIMLELNKNDFNIPNIYELKTYLQSNPLTVQYQLTTESIKTVDLMPSGTHPSTTPYCWKNGHIQLSSSGLLPNLEYSVVTSRAGQINQNATMIVKNDKRIFDLEILLAGGLVNTTYQALTLQNQVETGLSKVSLNSETEPDYLLYHMIMKLIEEKAYKLDDLTEKVSVFYLYEKLSDEQFETIYSALYPFVEDEIVEEPVVEELPEVVEDEVIM